MSLHDGFYELFRDNMKLPDFWISINNTCPPHFHATIELVYVQEKSIDALLNGTYFKVEKGEILVVPSYTTHRFTSPENSKSIELQIPLAYIRSFHEITRKNSFVETLMPNCEASREILRHMECLLKQGSSFGKDNFIVRGAIYSILGILIENVEMRETEKDSDHKKICNVLSYLQLNYQQQISLDTLATEFGYSRSRFSLIFNKNVGCSIPEYLNMLRSAKAASLLLDEDLSVTDAAMLAGFESTRTFYRAFSAQYGMTPRQYIETNRKREEGSVSPKIINQKESGLIRKAL